MFGVGLTGRVSRLGVALIAVAAGMFLADKQREKYLSEKSPAESAFYRGSMEMREVMLGWDGSVSPDEYKVDCPFNPDTQDALCRAFRAGALYMQSQIIEEKLVEYLGGES